MRNANPNAAVRSDVGRPRKGVRLIISVDLVDASRLPGKLDAFAVHKPGGVTFVVRDDYSAQQVADAIRRLGYEVTREAVDATYRRGQTTPEQEMRLS